MAPYSRWPEPVRTLIVAVLTGLVSAVVAIYGAGKTAGAADVKGEGRTAAIEKDAADLRKQVDAREVRALADHDELVRLGEGMRWVRAALKTGRDPDTQAPLPGR